MKWKQHLSRWENSTGTNKYYPGQCWATSYDHWTYVKRIDNQIVFNNYFYSTTTARHQSAWLNNTSFPEYDLMIEVPGGLDNLKSGLIHYKGKINSLVAAIRKPKSRKATNRQRVVDINVFRMNMHIIRFLMESDGRA